MGTEWKILIWDDLTDDAFEVVTAEAIRLSEEFDRTFSRFRADSFVCSLSSATGVVDVPVECTQMLRMYQRLYHASGGKLTPLIGQSISDAGYDAQYSLIPNAHIRPTPDFTETIRIIDDTHIDIKAPVLLDFGALGKGFMVDTIASVLEQRGVGRFLVDGSGDMRYRNRADDSPIRAGLEHPSDTTKAIGVFTMSGGALCGSGGNRRAWGNFHHILDPHSLVSPTRIAATWVHAESAARADALATCLFLVSPEQLHTEDAFEYCIMDSDHRIKMSDGFARQAEIFSA